MDSVGEGEGGTQSLSLGWVLTSENPALRFIFQIPRMQKAHGPGVCKLPKPPGYSGPRSVGSAGGCSGHCDGLCLLQGFFGCASIFKSIIIRWGKKMSLPYLPLIENKSKNKHRRKISQKVFSLIRLKIYTQNHLSSLRTRLGWPRNLQDAS